MLPDVGPAVRPAHMCALVWWMSACACVTHRGGAWALARACRPSEGAVAFRIVCDTQQDKKKSMLIKRTRGHAVCWLGFRN
jgi:hypothetical protein